MSRDERRAALIEATVPLLRAKGLAVSTRDIAAAAGVAEGTIFRVFDNKDELVNAALHSAFEPGPMLDRLAVVDMGQPLRERLIEVVQVIQERFIEVFSLMTAVGMVEPPETARHRQEDPGWRGAVLDRMLAVIEPDRDQLSVAPEQLTRLLRLLTFSGSHAEITNNQLLTPEEIVDALLYGTLTSPRRGEGTSC